jgi:hypothetical protein
MFRLLPALESWCTQVGTRARPSFAVADLETLMNVPAPKR